MKIRDPIDEKLVEILRRDGRASIRDIAEALELPESTARDRLHRLEEQGVILGYQAVVEMTALGYHLRAWITVEATDDGRDALRSFLQHEPAVMDAHFRPDIPDQAMALVVARDTADLNLLLAKFRTQANAEVKDVVLVEHPSVAPGPADQMVSKIVQSTAQV